MVGMRGGMVVSGYCGGVMIVWGGIGMVAGGVFRGCVYQSGLVSSGESKKGEGSAASIDEGRLKEDAGGNGGRRVVWSACRSGFQRLGELA